MKKISLLLTLIGIITLQSCNNDTSTNTIDNDTISEVFEYSNVNFLPNSYSVVLTYPHPIYDSDMVLVYRLSGIYQGAAVWKLVPETYYFADGTLDIRYDFDFTRFDTQVYMEGFNLPAVSSAYRLNQVFRVVIVPGFFGNKRSKLNFNDYNAVVRALHIDENSILKVK